MTLGPREGEFGAGVVEVACPTRRVRQVSAQHPDLLRMQAGQRDDPAQLRPTGSDLAATHEQPGPLGPELRQVVVVAELDGERDRLVEGADPRVVLTGDALQVAQ